MNEFYEHPAVMEIIRDYQSISMTINLNQSKIKNNLKHFESIFGQYKKFLEKLIEEIVDENIKRNNELESTMIDSKYFLSKKKKFEDDLELN